MAKKKAKQKVAKKKAKRVSGVNVIRATKPRKAIYEVTIRKKILGKAPEEYHFQLKSGEKLESLYDLIDAMTEMSEEVFRHHVNDMRNDFSTWIKDVFDDENLAKEIKYINHKVEAQATLMRKMIKELRKVARA